RESVVERSFQHGLGGILCPAELTSGRSLEVTLGLTERFSKIAAAAGVHPHVASRFRAEHLDALRALAAEKKICALGEVGLDFHYNLSPPGAQREAFRAQAALAGELGLPLIIHTREAGQEAADILADLGVETRGVFHCYTGDRLLAERLVAMGYFLSFSGILTFPGAGSLRETARRVPADRLLVETDSPFLVPVPHRGRVKRNEPRFVAEVAGVLAGLLGLAPERIAEATSGNYRRLFGPAGTAL
ncbi:MAG: TatD family deoxyribonuclease, partial [Candidatus Aminicenantes bacterium]|nr:TatD family deoxyribonuclease [Candidatus Aminicenantes bacterium]